jgi:hypothetical protein
MVDFNAQELISQGGSTFQKYIDQAKADLPFGSNTFANQVQQLGEAGSNQFASTVNDLAAGGRALVNQQSPFPKKHIMSFYLLDRNGNLVQPSDGSFQPGYLFNLLVNPSQFNITMPPKTIVPIRTLGGWDIQHWYPEIGSIQADGIIGNLLQRYNDDIKKTPNWQNFKKLLLIYQKNGIPYTGNKGIRGQREFNPIAVCVYHNVTYYGYFESFTFEEVEDSPWTRHYSFNYRFVDIVETQDIVEATRDKASQSVQAVAKNIVGPTSNAVNNALNSYSPF